MGLFSSKTVVMVDTSVSRVVKDEAVTNTARENLIKAIMENGSIPHYLVDGMLSSPSVKFHQMFDYGKREYVFGLPNSRIAQNTGNSGKVKTILDRETGQSVTVEYAQFGPINNIHVARQTLVDDYGLDQASNEIAALSNQHGKTCYLKDIVAVYSETLLAEADPVALQAINGPQSVGYTPERPVQRGPEGRRIGRYRKESRFLVEEDPGINAADVHYVFERDDGSIANHKIRLPVEGYDLTEDYFQVLYSYMEDSGLTYRYWTYRSGAGTYPALDRLHGIEYTDPGTYFPFVLFRQRGVNRAAEEYQDTEEYRTTSQLVSYMGMDYQSLSDAIHENPDIDDVEQAAMMMAVPLDSDHPVELGYLFEFFNDHYLQDPDMAVRPPYASSKIEMLDQKSQRDASTRGIWIADADFRINLAHSGMARSVRAGKKGPVGSYHSEKGERLTKVEYTKRARPNDDGAMITAYKSVAVPGIYLYHQTSEHIYVELWIENPRIFYDIDDGLGKMAKVGDPACLIPIDRRIAEKFPMDDREQLYLRSLHFVFNSRQEEKVKWYETGFFQFVITAVAAMVTFYTGAPAIAAAFAAGGMMAVAFAVATAIVKSLVIQEGFKLLVEEAGGEAAMLAAIAAAIYGGYKAFEAGSIEGAPWASELLQASSGLTKATQSVMQDLMLGLQDEAEDFALYKSEMQAELDRATELLDANSLLDPMGFIAQEPAFIPGEDPENFYHRTIHSGNIGTVGIEAIHRHAEIGLRLPTFQDSMGGTF